MNRNNVQISGEILSSEDKKNTIFLLIGISRDLIPIKVIIDRLLWENFKKNFPEAKSITVNGQLISKKGEFAIKTSQIRLFHNDLSEVLDESGINFHGKVQLSKKFDFQPKNHLYLKRMIFKTDISSFEATALRSIATFFNDIEEGDTIILKATYVIDQSQKNPPYWRIQQKPEYA